MTISDLGAYYGGAGAPASNPYAPYTLKNVTFQDFASFTTPTTFTFSNSYSTATGDCIVVGYSLTAGYHAITASGAGATWITGPSAQDGGNAPQSGFALGWGCSSGNTSITISTNTSGRSGCFIISIWGDVKSASTPVALVTGPTSNSGGAITSGITGTTVAQQLAIAVGAENTTNCWTAGTKTTFGGTNMNTVQIDNNQQALRMDAFVIVTGQTNPNVVWNPTAGSSGLANCYVLNHA